jgi:hypothetical protein
MTTQQPDYDYDDSGVKCRINPENKCDWQPCEPYCANCGNTPDICKVCTWCTGYECGRWFNEEQGQWIESESTVNKEYVTTHDVAMLRHKFLQEQEMKKNSKIYVPADQQALLRTKKQRLLELQQLLDEKLISEEEFTKARICILTD